MLYINQNQNLFIESETKEKNWWIDTITLHLQEFSAVNVKGATLKG